MSKNFVTKKECKTKHLASRSELKSIKMDVEEIKLALFGNDKVEFEGMIEKVNQMHKIFIGGTWTKKVVLIITAALGTIGGLIITYFKIIKGH